VEIFYGLDEMRLAEDEVGGVRLDDGHHGEFHGCAPARVSYAMVGRRKVIASGHAHLDKSVGSKAGQSLQVYCDKPTIPERSSTSC
jgi:hypothetical protein